MLSAGLDHPKCWLSTFPPGAVNALLAASTTISMRVVDKAFQLRHLSGDVMGGKKRDSLTGNAELGGSQNL